MSWERVWKLPGKRLDLPAIRGVAEQVAQAYAGVRVAVDWEDDDTVTCFFLVPEEGSQDLVDTVPDDHQVEISFYDLGSDGVVLSLEGEASDNDAAYDDACQLAEDMAELLDAMPIEV